MNKKISFWQKVVLIFLVAITIPVVSLAIYSFADSNKELNQAYIEIWLGTITPTIEVVQPESDAVAWFTTPIPSKSEWSETLYTNFYPWQGLCGDKIFIIRLHATWPDKVEIELGFVDETQIETHDAPKSFDTICYHIRILPDTTSWLLYVTER